MDKSEDLQTTETKETCEKKRRSFRHTRHKGDGYDNHRFFIQKIILFILYRAVPKADIARWGKENS